MTEIRTSANSPLRIAEVAAGSGLLGITLCPGKAGDSVVGGGVWRRDLAADLAVIKGWGATSVISLIEPHEFQLLSVQRLPDSVARHGMPWYHLPITDGAAPDHRFENQWANAGPDLLERLRQGERVVVHCRGGLGRAGTVAAKILVELGADPVQAMALVRAVRPGAIETIAQERWICRQGPINDSVDSRSEPAHIMLKDQLDWDYPACAAIASCIDAAGFVSVAIECLDLCCTVVDSPPPEVVAVAQVGRSDWCRGHAAFDAVRDLTLAEQRQVPCASGPNYLLLFVAENAARVIYNASKPDDPFDEDSGAWLLRTIAQFAQSLPDATRVTAAPALREIIQRSLDTRGPHSADSPAPSESAPLGAQ